MDELLDARTRMVDEQLVRRGIRNQLVLNAMRKVPRHLFINKKNLKNAYNDSPLPIGCSQTISQPYIVALMAEVVEPKKQKVVLEIGTGSGYQAAILAEIFKMVYSVERHPELATSAESLLKKMGYKNISIKIDDGTIGWEENSRFDAIIVSAAAPEVPDILVKQLKEHGRMAIPVGTHFQQSLKLIQKRGDSYISKTICGCVFVPLIGKGGWQE